jgi:hypothetical protein
MAELVPSITGVVVAGSFLWFAATAGRGREPVASRRRAAAEAPAAPTVEPAWAPRAEVVPGAHVVASASLTATSARGGACRCRRHGHSGAAAGFFA